MRAPRSSPSGEPLPKDSHILPVARLSERSPCQMRTASAADQGTLHHALAELEGRRLDLLREQDLLLLGEGRDVGDVAEVGNQRAALAGALALAFGVQPLAPHAHAIDRARSSTASAVGVGAELGVRSAPARLAPALVLAAILPAHLALLLS